GPLLGNRPRSALFFAGNEALKAEQLRSVELGYGTRLLNRKLAINLDFFYLEGIDLILFQSGNLIAALLGDPRATSTYRNLVDARGSETVPRAHRADRALGGADRRARARGHRRLLPLERELRVPAPRRAARDRRRRLQRLRRLRQPARERVPREHEPARAAAA